MRRMFEGQVAIVTGAGKGLGRSYARWFAKAGAKVVVNNRVRSGTPSSAELVVQEIRAEGGVAVADESSVEDPIGAERMVHRAIEAWGRADILICNAGFTKVEPLLDMDLDDIKAIMDVNFFGTLYPMLAAARIMRDTGYGRIVATASSVACFPMAGTGAYAASKSALIGLVRTLGVELGDRNVRVNLIAPGAYTSMSVGYIDESLKDIFSPDNVAPVVAWLASTACDVSGFMFKVGGGKINEMTFGENTELMVNIENIDAVMTELVK
jgi:NAD(P)-dependent dehydrogenase (short-subunit alcohol dehydrogenase family)